MNQTLLCGLRLNCRVCDSADLIDVVNLGNQYIVDFPEPVRVIEKDNQLRKAPLNLVLCNKCKLLQLGYSVNPDRLYKHFWYRSGISEVMRKALREVVSMARITSDLHQGDYVLDIGSNDGTLLAMYSEGIGTVGIDPCEELVKESIDCGRVDKGIADYFSADKVGMYGPFKVITAIAMFYDLDNPVEFLKDCAKVLHSDGMLILQFNYLKSMLEKMAFDNICHEHVTYFSLTTLSKVVNDAGMEIQGVQTNDVNGGSVRVFITHSGKQFNTTRMSSEMRFNLYAQYQSLLMAEDQMYLGEIETYRLFERRTESLCNAISRYLGESKQAGLRTYAYGASTRGTTLLQTLRHFSGTDVNNLIQGVAERDPHKYGRQMVGSWLPIIAEEEARKKAQQFMMLPYHFASGILERENDWIKQGGKFLIPLPVPRVRSKEGTIDLLTKEFSEAAA